MKLSTAKIVWTITMWLYVVSAVLSLVVLIKPSAFAVAPTSYVALAFLFLTALFGFASLLLIYYKQREAFHRVFGILLGFHYINSGLGTATWPTNTFGWSVFALATLIMPMVIAAMLRQVVRIATLGLEQAG